MTTIESTIERCYRELLGVRGDEPVDLQRRLVEEVGLSSLQLIAFVTAACEETGLPLTALTEQDIAHMKTASDIAAIIRNAFEQGSLP